MFYMRHTKEATEIALFYLNDIFTLYAIDELPLGKKITASLDPGFLAHTFIIYIKEKYSFSQP